MSWLRYSGPDVISVAKEWVLKHRWEGVICPACGRKNKVYHRPLSAGIARSLLVMYRRYGTDWCRPSQTVDNSGNIAKLEHWGLVESSGQQGEWRVTKKGAEFAEYRSTVESPVLLYNGDFLGIDPDAKLVDIVDCIGSPFDYAELMKKGKMP